MTRLSSTPSCRIVLPASSIVGPNGSGQLVMVGRQVQSVDNLGAKSNIASSMNSDTLSTAAGCDVALPRRPALGQIGHTSLARVGHLALAFPKEIFRYRLNPTVVLGRGVNDKVIEDVHDLVSWWVYRLT